MSMKLNKFGQKRDKYDSRDWMYSAPKEILAALPKSVDLRLQCSPAYDQGDLGSCTANAIGAAIQFAHNKQVKADLMPSRLFIYYNEREYEGTIYEDSGAYIRDGIKMVNLYGACPETLQPYDISRFTIKPDASCYTEAIKDKVVAYRRITQTLNQLKGCLASGYPFVFGFMVYKSFMSIGSTGIATMPRVNDQLLGGHAVMAVGYNEKSKRFIVRNSWGSSWGMNGYFTMPYAYLTRSDLSGDFQNITMIAG